MNELKKEITKLEKKRNKLTQEIQEKEKLLKDTCTHNQVHTVNKYIEGSYYDKAEYITQEVCTDCGKILREMREYGSYA